MKTLAEVMVVRKGRDLSGQAEEEESGGFGWEFVGSEVSDGMVSGFCEYLWQGSISKKPNRHQIVNTFSTWKLYIAQASCMLP